MSKTKEIKDISKDIVEVVYTTTNDYDARYLVENGLAEAVVDVTREIMAV